MVKFPEFFSSNYKMSKTQNLKRQIEELDEEKMQLEQDSKRLKQDNKLYQVQNQKSMEKQEYIR